MRGSESVVRGGLTLKFVFVLFCLFVVVFFCYLFCFFLFSFFFSMMVETINNSLKLGHYRPGSEKWAVDGPTLNACSVYVCDFPGDPDQYC